MTCNQIPCNLTIILKNNKRRGGVNMRRKLVSITSIILIFITMLHIMTKGHIVSAADNTVKILIGDGTSARHHMSMTKGNTSDEYHFELKGYEAKSSTYTSSNPSAFRIVNTKEGVCRVEGIEEGTGLVTLTVKTKTGETLTEKVFVSICTKLEQCQAKTRKNIDVYRGASANSGVENSDKKDTLSENVQITLTAECGNFYSFKTNDGSLFSDDSDTGFVKKSDVKILVGAVTMQEQNISMELGSNKKLNVKVTPDIAADKSLVWSIGNDNVAVVDFSGKISGISEGTTAVTVTAKDGSNQSAATYISVYKSIEEVSANIKSNTDLYAVGNNKCSIGKGSEGDKLTIIGTCGDYYRVKVDKNFIDEHDKGYCYVMKTKVTIPVAKIKLNYSKVSLLPNKKIHLTAAVSPSIADNKNIKWSSSDEKIATVDSKGNVITKKTGRAMITAVSEDGLQKEICEVDVGENGYASASKKTKQGPRLSKKSVGFDHVFLWVDNEEPYNGIEVYVDGEKRKKDYTCSKKYSLIWIKVDKLSNKQTYKIQVKTYLKKKGKKIYSKISNEIKVATGKTKIKAYAIQDKALTISWDKIENAKKYKIYRANTKNGKYKCMKTVKGNQSSYTDEKVQLKKTYYYKVEPVNSRGTKGTSNKACATACKLQYVADYMTKKYKTICMDKKKNMNSYHVNGNYSPVKYKFADNMLQIHVYLEFVTYADTGKVDDRGDKIYKKKKASVKGEISTKKYISMFQEGIKKAYKIDAIGTKKDFKKGINFKTKLVIHEKKSGKKFNANQKFFEVLIGGECPNCTNKGNHWYHAGTNYNAFEYREYGNTPTIYMPTNEQVRTNKKKEFNTPKDDYGSTAAHELGHILGLDDAYYDSDKGYDRCADNSETGYKYCDKHYDNLMKHHVYYKKINTNGIEMLLEAVDENTGMPYFASQCFNNYSDMKISRVIKNDNDDEEDK